MQGRGTHEELGITTALDLYVMDCTALPYILLLLDTHMYHPVHTQLLQIYCIRTTHDLDILLRT